jgi:hypothetical protein
MEVAVNYVAVLLAAVASMLVGFAWYSPALFGKPWMKLMGYTQESLKKAQKQMGSLYAISFVLSLVSAYVLSHVMVLSENYFHYDTFSTGINTAFWMWVGFVMPVQLTGEIFGGKKWMLFVINSGYQLASMLLMAIVLSLM